MHQVFASPSAALFVLFIGSSEFDIFGLCEKWLVGADEKLLPGKVADQGECEISDNNTGATDQYSACNLEIEECENVCGQSNSEKDDGGPAEIAIDPWSDAQQSLFLNLAGKIVIDENRSGESKRNADHGSDLVTNVELAVHCSL